MSKIRFNFTIAAMAIPLILSNLTVPMLGLTNTYIAGHLNDYHIVAAIGLGSVIFDFLYWGFGFLRMGTTGLISLAVGKNNTTELLDILSHSLVVALLLGLMMILFKSPIGDGAFSLIHGSAKIKTLAAQYYHVRILAAPATLMNYVLMGAFIGIGNTRLPLLLSATINAIAMVLGFELSFHYHMPMTGIAAANVVAQYCGLAVGLLALFRLYSQQFKQYCFMINTQLIKKLISVNRDIFIRTLFLILAYTFFTFQSLKLGAEILAANTILIEFMAILGYAQDGFANVAESLIGKEIGQKNTEQVIRVLLDAGVWAVTVSVMFFFIYLFCSHQIINMMTDLSDIRTLAYHFTPYVVVLPLISVWCFFFDGVFIGSGKFQQMRNTMVLSFVSYIVVWFCLKPLQNVGLWIAILSFFAFRAIFMATVMIREYRHKQFFRPI